MSPAKKSGPDVDVNPLLSRLLSHGVEASVLRGYVGPSKKEGTVSLYPALGKLNHYIEIDQGDIVETAPAPTNVLPHNGTVVWVKSDAEVVLHGDTVVTVPARTLRRPRPAVDETTAEQPSPDAADYVDVVRGRLRMSVRTAVQRSDCSVCASCGPCSSCSGICQSGPA